MGSSIIFLVVIAIWAVFLLPDLQIRRHQLAQARATNRMLSTSRVLKRDNPFSPDTTTADSEVALATDSSDPTLSATVSGSTAITASAEPETEMLDMSAVLAGEAQQPAPVTGRDVAKPANPNKTLAWILAGCLLTSLIAVPLTITLAAFNVLAWWSVLVALAALVGCVAALRYRATRRRAARRAARNVTQPASRRQERVIDLRDAPVVHAREPVTSARPQTEAAFDQAEIVDEDEDPESEVEPASVLQGPTAPPTKSLPAVDDRPGVWTPPKVPRPTYLMKPRLPQGPLAPPNIGVTTTNADPFGDLLESGDDDVDLPQSRAV